MTGAGVMAGEGAGGLGGGSGRSRGGEKPRFPKSEGLGRIVVCRAGAETGVVSVVDVAYVFALVSLEPSRLSVRCALNLVFATGTPISLGTSPITRST
jgi:hypothetical protein